MYDNEILEAMEYQMYIAEKELIENITEIVLEADSAAYQEQLFTTIKDYLKKVITGLDNVFKRFVAKIEDKAWKGYYETNKKYLSVDRPIRFSEDPKDTDLDPKFGAIDQLDNGNNPIDAGSYSSEDYEDELAFVKSKYPYFSSIEKYSTKALKDYAFSQCFEKIQKGREIGGERVAEYVEFMNNFKEKVDQITKDIDTVRQSANQFERQIDDVKNATPAEEEKPVEAPANEPQNQETTNQEAAQIANELVKIITEAKFTDAEDPEGEHAKSGSNDSEIKKLTKKVTRYYKVTTGVLSAKLAVYNKAYMTCFSLCNSYAQNAKKYV